VAGSSRQSEMVRTQDEGHQHVVLVSPSATGRRIEKGEADFPMKLQFDHNAITDIMFLDVCPVAEGDQVAVVDVGVQLGFPGQIQARVNLDKGVFYGLTIQNFSGFKRTLQWRYRMFSIQRALRFLVLTLLAGLRIDQNAAPQRHALCR
jgi:hypothetical protein